MDKNLFKNEEPLKRFQLLKDNCDSMEKMSYQRKFTDDELLSKKNELSELMVKNKDLQEEIKNLKSEYKARIDPLKEDVSKLITDVKWKSENVTEDCFKMIDHHEGRVGYYNSDGELISERQVLPEENQFRMNLNKAINE
jgi:seryl-tRNA synthetase